MMSFGEKELEALALVEPTNAGADLNDKGNDARKTQKRKIGSKPNKMVRFCRLLANEYRRHRELKSSEKHLYAMTNRELSDIGIVRTEITSSIETSKKLQNARLVKLLKSVLRKVKKARKAKATYVHLMNMENRQLADIGLTRGDINAALLGTKYKFANANLVRASNDNDHRRVS